MKYKTLFAFLMDNPEQLLHIWRNSRSDLRQYPKYSYASKSRKYALWDLFSEDQLIEFGKTRTEFHQSKVSLSFCSYMRKKNLLAKLGKIAGINQERWVGLTEEQIVERVAIMIKDPEVDRSLLHAKVSSYGLKNNKVQEMLRKKKTKKTKKGMVKSPRKWTDKAIEERLLEIKANPEIKSLKDCRKDDLSFYQTLSRQGKLEQLSFLKSRNGPGPMPKSPLDALKKALGDPDNIHNAKGPFNRTFGFERGLKIYKLVRAVRIFTNPKESLLLAEASDEALLELLTIFELKDEQKCKEVFPQLHEYLTQARAGGLHKERFFSTEIPLTKDVSLAEVS